jgi:outer membrane protein assembly factor BamB
MKTLLLSLFVITSNFILAQITYTFRIKDTRNNPLTNVQVTTENKERKHKLVETTDSEGKVVFNLTEIGTYSFSYLEIKDIADCEVKEGRRGTFSRSVTYDPNGIFAEKPKANRNGISFQTFQSQQNKDKQSYAKLTVLLKQMDKTLVSNVNIALVSVPLKSKFIGKSNSAGFAVFYLPVNNQYEIDIENLEALQTVDVPNFENLEMTEVVYYEKSKVKEKILGDTIYQNSIANKTGSTTHNLFTLQLNDLNGNPLENEPVYLKAMSSARVYSGVTDSKGSCSFLIEKGDNYAVNLKYESNIHLVEAPITQGFRTEGATRRYRGSKQIEKMKEEQQAEMERMEHLRKLEALRPKPGDEKYVMTFHSTPVHAISAPQNYLTKTENGFQISLNQKRSLGTPTVIGNSLFTQESYYSPNYYCFNATNGQFVWGVGLGESGVSPAVYHNGVLLINTESCTLYAIDAKTGKLLWSKWLAGHLETTPSADDSQVYAVYRHGGYPVIVSFDLRTGEQNWVNRVDAETIACAVVDKDEVHLSSRNGTYYAFNKNSGLLIQSISTYKMVTSPTLTADKIFVTAIVDEQERLIALDRKTFQLIKKYPFDINSSSDLKEILNDDDEPMSYNGPHPVVYKNKFVIVSDGNHIRVFDAMSDRLLWSQEVKSKKNQLPIVSNNKVIIASLNGQLLSFDIESGTSNTLKTVNKPFDGQPIARNGFLYLSAGGILTVIKSMQNFEWNQWNKDASHNTIWD